MQASSPNQVPGPRRDAPGRLRHRLAVLALGIGAVLIAVFGLRAWHQLEFNARVSRGEVHVEALRGWMTLPYIARAYDIPEDVLRSTLGAPPTGDGQRSLRDWIAATGQDPLAARRSIETLILERRPAADRPGS